MCESSQIPVSPCVMRPRRSTAVASMKTAPAPPCANLPRCTMCQSLTWPSWAEYWHIGEITTRLRKRTPRSSIGWKSSGIFIFLEEEHALAGGLGIEALVGLVGLLDAPAVGKDAL